MKKILAIALAVVMVLSMTSAFAASFDWSWPCPVSTDKNGKATIELIPYVKVNTGCDTFDWVQSNCAAAVQTENVYFVVKMTVPADINPIWYKHTTGVTFTYADGGFVLSKAAEVTQKLEMPNLGDDTEEDGWVFYAVNGAAVTTGDLAYDVDAAGATGAWAWTVDQSKDVASGAKLTVPDKVMNKAAVLKASKAKICASFTSNFDGMGEWLTFGDYKVYVERSAQTKAGVPSAIHIIPECAVTSISNTPFNGDNADFATNTDSLSTKATNPTEGLANAGTSFLSCTVDNDKIETFVTNISGVACDKDFAADARKAFGLDLNTCITAKNIKANFGWKDKVESCFTWSGNATAIVDVQCEVEIPKTGDVSVIAYAVMAVVAAAGAMGLKK